MTTPVNDNLREPEPADAFALLRAHLAGDEASVENICRLVDERALFPMTVGVLIEMLVPTLPGGADELDETLARWQRERVLGS